MKSSDIPIRAISQEMPQPSVTKIRLKITYLNFHSNFPGANELNNHQTWHKDSNLNGAWWIACGPLGSVSLTVYELIIEIFKIGFCSKFICFNDSIRSQFCTWHNSWAVRHQWNCSLISTLILCKTNIYFCTIRLVILQSLVKGSLITHDSSSLIQDMTCTAPHH